jgi:hypothetical protein
MTLLTAIIMNGLLHSDFEKTASVVNDAVKNGIDG